jgi:hypothetical protein
MASRLLFGGPKEVEIVATQKKKKKKGSEPIIYSILFCTYSKGEVRKELEQKALGPWLIIGFAMVSSKSQGTMKFNRPWPKPLLECRPPLILECIDQMQEYISHCHFACKVVGTSSCPLHTMWVNIQHVDLPQLL